MGPDNQPEIDAGLAPTPGYRYAQVVGPELFVAGQVPLDESGALVAPGDPFAQAQRCLENLRTLIAVHGFAEEDLRRITVYVVGEHPVLLDAWRAVTEWFEGSAPPATLIGVHLLGYAGQVVEIDATVVSSAPGAPPEPQGPTA